MKVANTNIINITAKSYTPYLLSLVPPNSQVKEQPEITICDQILSKIDQSDNSSNKAKFTKRKRKLQQRKKSKNKKQVV